MAPREDDDDEDLLCIDKQDICIDNPDRDKPFQNSHKESASSKQDASHGAESNADEYDEEEYDDE